MATACATMGGILIYHVGIRMWNLRCRRNHFREIQIVNAAANAPEEDDSSSEEGDQPSEMQPLRLTRDRDDPEGGFIFVPLHNEPTAPTPPVHVCSEMDDRRGDHDNYGTQEEQHPSKVGILVDNHVWKIRCRRVHFHKMQPENSANSAASNVANVDQDKKDDHQSETHNHPNRYEWKESVSPHCTMELVIKKLSLHTSLGKEGSRVWTLYSYCLQDQVPLKVQ